MAPHRRTFLSRPERRIYVGLLATLTFAAFVALSGHSGAGGLSVASTTCGVILAAVGGVAISLVTMLCRGLNDSGVAPVALLALRFPGTVLAALALGSFSSGTPTLPNSLDVMLIIVLFLIIAASYVNQLAISLASPLTIRAVLASGPVLIFLFQMVEGRLSASLYTLTAAILYAMAAIAAGLARQRAIQSKAVCG